jgi:hypothetical protein
MTLSHDLQDHIRERAFLIYRERGEEKEAALDHWLTAEREIRSALSFFVAFEETDQDNTQDQRDRINYDDFMALRRSLDRVTANGVKIATASPPPIYLAAPGFRRTTEAAWGPGAIEVLNAASSTIAALVATGGVKMVVDLIKAWVEERKGRRIRIAANGVEVEIAGGTSPEDIARAVSLLERLAAQPKPNISEPSPARSQDV